MSEETLCRSTLAAVDLSGVVVAAAVGVGVDVDVVLDAVAVEEVAEDSS